MDPETNERFQAEPGRAGMCPLCGSIVFSKTGNLRIWHFSHQNRFKSQIDCESWSENEGEWHLAWKNRLPEHMREYVIKRQRVLPNGLIEQTVHRADILNSRGTVIELQHSPINASTIYERETFYENMIWIFDAQEWTFRNPEKFSDGIRYWWVHGRKHLAYCKAPVFFHMGGRKILHVSRITIASKRSHVEGRFISFDDFLEIYFR